MEALPIEGVIDRVSFSMTTSNQLTNQKAFYLRILVGVQACGNTMPDLSDLVQEGTGQVNLRSACPWTSEIF